MVKLIHREITELSPEDSFLVFDRIKDDFDCPIHFHPEFELNFIQNGKGVRRIIGDHIEEIDNIELVFRTLFAFLLKHLDTSLKFFAIFIHLKSDCFKSESLTKVKNFSLATIFYQLKNNRIIHT